MLKKFVKLREGVYLGSARDMYIEDIAYLIGKGFALFWFDLREGKIVERGYYSRADLIFAAKNREDFISFLKRNFSDFKLDLSGPNGFICVFSKDCLACKFCKVFREPDQVAKDVRIVAFCKLLEEPIFEKEVSREVMIHE